MTLVKRPQALALFAIQAVAFWPVWRWVAARIGDGSGEGAALAACAAALLVRPRSVASLGQEGTARALGVWLTVAYAVSAALAPPVLSAALAFSALLVSWSIWRFGTRPPLAAFGLVVLALPALPTAQFMLGFPLRVVAGEVAVRLLAFAGFAVVRQGTSLRFGERLIAIDAPCSGVHMLWTALLLALCLASFGRLDARRTVLLVSAGGALAIAANALRAAALFFPESGLIVLPASAHSGIGVVTFALAGIPLLLLYRRLQAPPRCETSPAS